MPQKNKDIKPKLTIIPLKADFTKGEEIKTMYNPSEITIENRNQFQRTAVPGLPTPVTQFVSGETQTISFDLFFDTYEDRKDVRDETNMVLNLAKIDKDLHTPPVCQFTWGGDIISEAQKLNFKGVIDSITQRFTMFLDDGTPVRATLSLKISKYQTIEEQLIQLGLKSADRTKVKVFKEGDSLWLLAHTEYNNPVLWREIAKANKIDNPRLLTPGTELTIPPLEGDIGKE